MTRGAGWPTYALMGNYPELVAVGPFDHEEAAADWGEAHEAAGWAYHQAIRVASVAEWGSASPR